MGSEKKPLQITNRGHRMRNRAPYIKALAFAALMVSTALPARAENLVGYQAVLRALDKVTATTQDITVNVGDTLQYGSLDIAVRHCEKRPPEETPEVFAFLQVKDARLDGKGEAAEKAKLFSGWMFASSPALSALEHPVYDVWVLDCIVPKVEEAETDLANTQSE